MASELTVTILRYAFLALIWFFVFLVVSAARRDLGLGKNYRAAADSPFAACDYCRCAGWRHDAAGRPADYYWPR
mgnify:CR=1 FL=1